MTAAEKRYLPAGRIAAWLAFLILLACYWATVPPTVSFWDCPEYVSAAYLLEVGHPPGNPMWMLVERMVTLLVPPQYAALAINLSSGVFTAFASFFLALTIFRVALWITLKKKRRHIPAPITAAAASFIGALAFGFCDSAWFSAVEAEVYAMSIFLSALCVWLMTVWAGTRSRHDSWQLLVLLAYIFGLSIGVHQLNLLCIPALAMIWAVKRSIRSLLKLAFIFCISLLAVACILIGMMPSTIAIAARFELIAVNSLGLPRLAGVAIYVASVGISLLIALIATSRSTNRGLMAAACFPAIFLSGIFTFSEHFLLGAAISMLVAALLVRGKYFQARRLYLAMWMLALLLCGYSSYALIPIRGHVMSPANSAMPDNPFTFAAYQSREQYGSSPLLYGPTPYSKPMLNETVTPEGKYLYTTYTTIPTTPRFVEKEEGMSAQVISKNLSKKDSARNAELLERPGNAYILRTFTHKQVKTPELNMWFPRIKSSNPIDLKSYADWLGMDSASMVRVEISEAYDSLGHAVPKRTPGGDIIHTYSYRPTYLQNLQWLVAYQTGYMYWRYLMWNFSGRQNDIAAQGEVQHGNFITGFPAIDNAMLGAEDHLPPEAGSENKGRNRLFMLPLILGLIGIGWLFASGRRGKQADATIAVLFIMSGLAITIYLNQDPCEPRERDYSFLGSFWAYAIWIGFGALAIIRWCKSLWGFLIPLAIVAWMGIENFDDHNRSHRYVASTFPRNVLNSLEPNSIIFVNGDNLTFPLWYSQEVEGVRRDVRVVNLAYLSTPAYAANMLADWRESKALPSILKRSDFVWGQLLSAKIPNNSDTIPAAKALEILGKSDNKTFPSRYVSVQASPDSTIVIDLHILSKTGTSSVTRFDNLMILNLAVSALEDGCRPVYWLAQLTRPTRAGLTEATSPWLYGYRLGVLPTSVQDSLDIRNAGVQIAPNLGWQDVYMDHVPAVQISIQRAGMVAAARRLMEHGHHVEAADILLKADMPMGEHYDSFGTVLINDSAFSARRELSLAMSECADSLTVMLHSDKNLDKAARNRLEANRALLKARGRHHLDTYKKRRSQWLEYVKNLPPRLRNKIAPIP